MVHMNCMEEWATSHSIMLYSYGKPKHRLSSMVDVKATLKLSENLLSSSYIIGFGLQYCPTEQCPCLYT